MNDIKMRMQKLEESVESKLTIMNIEFRHKLELHETKTKHDLETMRLKTEIDRLRQQENRNHSCEIRTHVQKNSKCSASYDQQLPVTTLTPQVLRHDTSAPVPTLPQQVQQHDTNCAQPQVPVPTLPPQVQRYDKNIQPPQYHPMSRPMPINVYNQLPNMPIFRVSKVLPSQQPVTHIQTALPQRPQFIQQQVILPQNIQFNPMKHKPHTMVHGNLDQGRHQSTRQRPNLISQRRNPPEKHQKENVNIINSQENHLQRSKEMCNKSNDSSQLKAKDNSCEQKLYISSDKGIETMEVKTNADIHDTNISECDKEYSNGSVNKSQHFLGHGRATNLIHRRRKSL